MFWKPIFCPKNWPEHAGQRFLLTVENVYGQLSVAVVMNGYGDGKVYAMEKAYMKPGSQELDSCWMPVAWAPLPEAYNPYNIDVRYLIEDVEGKVRTPRSTIEIQAKLLPLIKDHIVWNDWQNFFFRKWEARRSASDSNGLPE